MRKIKIIVDVSESNKSIHDLMEDTAKLILEKGFDIDSVFLEVKTKKIYGYSEVK